MLSAGYMKKPRTQEENVDKFISTTIEYVKMKIGVMQKRK